MSRSPSCQTHFLRAIWFSMRQSKDDLDPIARVAGSRTAGGRPQSRQIFFDRQELRDILNVYGRMVAAGQWRDYRIEEYGDKVAFAVFRRASEMPAYRILKNPAMARKQGAYSIQGGAGQILKRGQDLVQMLRLFDRRLLRLVD